MRFFHIELRKNRNWRPAGDQGEGTGERIYFDAEWWNVQKVQLDRVYLNGFLPEFACPRRPSKPVRGYVLSSGREMIIDGKKEWAKEWSVNDANELIKLNERNHAFRSVKVGPVLLGESTADRGEAALRRSTRTPHNRSPPPIWVWPI